MVAVVSYVKLLRDSKTGIIGDKKAEVGKRKSEFPNLAGFPLSAFRLPTSDFSAACLFSGISRKYLT